MKKIVQRLDPATGLGNHNLIEMSSWIALINASRDDNNTLDQIYIKQKCSSFYYYDFIFSKHYTKVHANIEVELKLDHMSFLL